MPLVPPTMTGLAMAKAASNLIAGSKLPSIVSAVTSATCQYLLAAATVNTVNVAVGPGSGTQTGRIYGLVPALMSATMQLKAASLGLFGRDLGKIFGCVSFGVVNGLNLAVVQGVIIGAGPGTGTGKILGLVPVALQGLILAQDAFRLIAGSKTRDLASCMAFGICTHIMTVGTVVVTDIGVFTPPPVGPVPVPAAPGFGRLI